MAYGDAHRFLLRTVASQGVLSITDAQAVLERFNGEEDLSVSDLVTAINDEIRPYYQEIKMTRDEVSNEEVIVFLSLADDAATKAQNIFSATELEYFRVLIEQIMSTESRQITGINAMNLVSNMKSKFTKTDAQKVLNTWCRMRYFDKEQDNYALGVRAIHEFEGYFRQNMPDVVEECYLCKHIVFRGYNCIGCSQAIHTRCLMRYVEKVQKWPCCKIDFEQEQLERLNSIRLSQTPVPITYSAKNTITTTIIEEPTQVPTTRHSPSNTIVEEPVKVPITRHSPSNTNVEEPTKVPTTRNTARKTSVEEPTKLLTIRHSPSNTIVDEPVKVPITRHSPSNTNVEEPTKVPTTRNTARKTSVEEPTIVTTTRKSARKTIVKGPTKVPTVRISPININVEEPTKVPTKRNPASKTSVEEPTNVPTTRQSTRKTIANPKMTQRVTRKRKQEM